MIKVRPQIFSDPSRIICKALDEDGDIFYQMYSKEKYLGYMSAYPAIDKNGPHLFIQYLVAVTPRKQKVGTDFVSFAKELSQQFGCPGHIEVKASHLGGKSEVSHIFWRKMGFSSEDRKQLRKLDRKMLFSKELPFTFKPMDMYLPTEKIPPENIFRRLYLWKKSFNHNID